MAVPAKVRTVFTSQRDPLSKFKLHSSSLCWEKRNERAFCFCTLCNAFSTRGRARALITVEGANHYGITNQDSDRDPSRPMLDQATANGATLAVSAEQRGRWSGLFLRELRCTGTCSQLLGDQRAFDYVYKTGGDLDPNVDVTGLSSV